MNAAKTVSITPHSIAKPVPKLLKKSSQGVWPIAQEPNLAPSIAHGTPIKINQ